MANSQNGVPPDEDAQRTAEQQLVLDAMMVSRPF